MKTYETLLVEIDEGAALVTLNRPAALNALSLQLCRDLLEAFAELREAQARAVVLTGAGRAFCAGGDLREMQQLAQLEGRLEAFFEAPLRTLHDCIRVIRDFPAPVIAAVNGPAFGAGCNLALACDLVVAGESAQFNESFVRIGLSTDCGGTFILPRLVGLKRAAELLFTGATVDAHSAANWGMINRVVSDNEVLATAQGLAAQLAQGPTGALARIKQLLAQSAVNDYSTQLDAEAAAQLISGQSLDFKEGVAGFFEKRPPDFTGR
jgi:2-(1,2-epoxy-1,2-dihydrophenyl)acetyl-CoA isomerase